MVAGLSFGVLARGKWRHFAKLHNLEKPRDSDEDAAAAAKATWLASEPFAPMFDKCQPAGRAICFISWTEIKHSCLGSS